MLVITESVFSKFKNNEESSNLLEISNEIKKV